MKQGSSSNGNPGQGIQDTDWFLRGYEKGRRFARDEADFDDLAAIRRAGAIPATWDIFRAEILNEFLGEEGFDFQQYAAGFAKACIEYLDQL